MALLDEIGDYLTAQGLVGGATGWTLALSQMPTSPDKIVAIFETPGRAPLPRVEMDMPAFQVRVRGTVRGYADARTKLAAVQAVLHGLANTSLSGVYYVSILAQGSAISMGNDENNRPEISQNYLARRSR